MRRRLPLLALVSLSLLGASAAPAAAAEHCRGGAQYGAYHGACANDLVADAGVAWSGRVGRVYRNAPAGPGPYTYVDWGDGTRSQVDGWLSVLDLTHTYEAPGTYTVSVTEHSGAYVFGQIIEEQATAKATATVRPTAPRALGRPKIDGSTAAAGGTLTATAPDFSQHEGPAGLSYLWQRCGGGTCTTIGRAAAQELVPADLGQKLRVKVTATNDVGDGASEWATTPVIGAPVMTRGARLTKARQLGETLTATAPTFAPASDVVQRTWLRCDAEGAGCAPFAENKASHVLTQDDAGHVLRLQWTATSAHGTTKVTSGQSERIGMPVIAAAPVLTGGTYTGQTLTATSPAVSPADAQVVRSWERCGPQGQCERTDATGTTYTVTDADAGHSIRYVVTATTAVGEVTRSSKDSGELNRPEWGKGRPAIAPGGRQPGDVLTVTAPALKGRPSAVRYDWFLCNEVLDCYHHTSTSTPSLELADWWQGRRVRVQAVAETARGEEVKTPTSYTTSVIGGPELVEAPTVSGSTRVGGVLTVTAGTYRPNDAVRTIAWLSCKAEDLDDCRAVGENSTTYTVEASELGRRIRAEVVASANGAEHRTRTWPKKEVTAAE